jgi:hypothetical protein
MNFILMKVCSIKKFVCLVLFIFSIISYSQQDSIKKPKSEFWKKVQFGGGLGLGVGNGFTNISLQPQGIYQVNQKVGLGVGINGSYISQRDLYQSTIFGGSVITLVNPVDFAQLSAEIEQLRVSTSFENSTSDSFWNTALFLGAGYRSENVVFGLRYNVLHKDSNNVYSQAWLPFVRVMF